MARGLNQQSFDQLRSLGKSLGQRINDTETMKRQTGLLPQVERKRGSMGVYKAHIAPFVIHDTPRQVFLNLEFFPIYRQYIQGAHGYWVFPSSVWDARFKQKTTPGRLLIIFVGTRASVFEGTGATMAPPTFYAPDVSVTTQDTDWQITSHITTPVGHPFVAAHTMAWRFVRPGERTLTPVQVHGGPNPANGGPNSTGCWVWEIENAQAPDASTVQTIALQGLSDHQLIDLPIGDTTRGNVIGGFVTALFDRDSAPIVTYPNEMHKVAAGTPFATKRNDIVSRLFDGAWSYGAFSNGNQWDSPVVDGDYWQQTWNSDVTITQVSMLSLFPWVLYAPSNPSGVLTIDERQVDSDGNVSYTGLDYTVSGAVNFYLGATGRQEALGLDLIGARIMRGMRFTYLGTTAPPPYGPADSGWNEITNWFDDPTTGFNIQSADIENNPLPYHGIFAGGINALSPPWMYIQQKGEGQGDILAEVYNDLIGGSPWSVAGASIIVPGLKQRLPTIPYPVERAGEFFSSDNSAETGESLTNVIVEKVTIITSGDGQNMPADLYASGVRVFIDEQDISQYIFNGPSGVIDINNWRFDNIDISQWVKNPGQHRLVVTCDEGDADVDARFEVF